MNPESVKKRLIISMLVTIVVAGIAVGLALYYLLPAYWFRWYPLIPVFFMLLGLFMSLSMNHYSKREPKKMITILMLMRGVKILLTAGGVLLYYWLVGERMTEVLLVTLGFYLLHLFVETYLFYRFEKATKQIRSTNA